MSTDIAADIAAVDSATTAPAPATLPDDPTGRWEKKSSSCGWHQTLYNIAVAALNTFATLFALASPFAGIAAAVVVITLAFPGVAPVIVAAACVAGALLGAICAGGILATIPSKWTEWSDSRKYANADEVCNMAHQLGTQESFYEAVNGFFQYHPIEKLEQYGFVSPENAQAVRYLMHTTAAHRKVVKHFEESQKDAIRDQHKPEFSRLDYSYLAPYEAAKAALAEQEVYWGTVCDRILSDWPKPAIRV